MDEDGKLPPYYNAAGPKNDETWCKASPPWAPAACVPGQQPLPPPFRTCPTPAAPVARPPQPSPLRRHHYAACPAHARAALHAVVGVWRMAHGTALTSGPLLTTRAAASTLQPGALPPPCNTAPRAVDGRMHARGSKSVSRTPTVPPMASAGCTGPTWWRGSALPGGRMPLVTVAQTSSRQWCPATRITRAAARAEVRTFADQTRLAKLCRCHYKPHSQARTWCPQWPCPRVRHSSLHASACAFFIGRCL